MIEEMENVDVGWGNEAYKSALVIWSVLSLESTTFQTHFLGQDDERRPKIYFQRE